MSEVQMEDVRKVLKEEICDLKAYITENMVCIPHCGERHGKLDLKIQSIEQTQGTEKTERAKDYKNIRSFVYVLSFVIIIAEIILAWMRGYLDAIYTAMPNMHILSEKMPELIKLMNGTI